MENMFAHWFWSRVDKKTDNECWHWTKYINNGGYGRTVVKGKPTLTHRIAWEITNGKIPDGMFVLHKCDNRKCCNPNHLFIGTLYDNTQDCIQKNRREPGHLISERKRGERHHRARLTEQIVIAIKSEIGTNVAVGKKYGIGADVVSRIRNGKAWSHVLCPQVTNSGSARGTA